MNRTSLSQDTPARRLKAAIDALGTPLAPVNRRLVAEKAGVPAQILSDLEYGKRRLTAHWAEKLGPVLGVTPGYLLGMGELPEGSDAA